MNRRALAFSGSAAFVLFVIAAVLPVISQKPADDLKPTIILVSLDGFRYDYPEKYSAPALSQVAKHGVRAKWMVPSFPTKTFPNHYTVVTGLYPQNHGLVENNVYDFGTVFSMSKRAEVQNPRWWLGEPVWVTAEKQGQKAASFFWPGTETAIGGVSPSHWRTFNDQVPNIMRVDKTLAHLDRPAAERPTIMTLYFSTTDDVGHEFGPDSEEMRYGVLEADGYIQRLMDGLKARGLDDKVNVIITSDHGMAPVYPKQVTLLDEHFDFDLTERILWTREIVQIFPKPGKAEEIYSKIKDLKHTTCWKKGEIPARLNYNDGPRVAPIVCSSEIGWMTSESKWYNDWFRNLEDKDRPRGAHGYDNRYREMQATFIAHGPAFKKGFVAEPFENIHLYELMCKILGLRPAKNDGSLDKVKDMLRGAGS